MKRNNLPSCKDAKPGEVCLNTQCGLHRKNKFGSGSYAVSHSAARFSSGALDHIIKQQKDCKAKKFIGQREVVSNDLLDQHFNSIGKRDLSPVKESPDETPETPEDETPETPEDDDDSMEDDTESDDSKDDGEKKGGDIEKDSDKEVLERVENGIRAALSDSLCTGSNPEVCEKLATLADYIRVHLG
jgi:TATA-binding protein-associated factor Taf7